MKKLSLFSLLGLTGLLAFIATPTYAQDENAVVENIAAETENLVDETVGAAEEIADETAGFIDETADAVEEAVDETAEALDETVDAVETVSLDGVEDFNSLFENDEVQNALNELNLTNEEAAGLLGLFAGLGTGLLIVLGVIGIILWILRIIALWKAFERAGEGGWKALIPVYCSYIKYKLAGMKNWFWYALLIALIMGIIATCIPDQKDLITNIASIITSIIYIVMTFKFARKYGWGVFASILFVLFYPICILILGFGNYKYEGKSQETIVEA